MIETQGILSFAIVVVILLGTGVAAVLGIRTYNKPTAPIRRRDSKRIPARERELLGDDWRDKIGW